MSVDRNAVIVRGFVLEDCPYEKYPDDFNDQWIINFNGWFDGPYIAGYQIKATLEEGVPFELGCTMGDPMWDDFLIEACRNVGVPIGEIKTYFGVKIS